MAPPSVCATISYIVPQGPAAKPSPTMQTPAKSRFLPSKRQTAASQKQTSTPFPSSAPNHQFASTPRFNTPAALPSASHQPPIFSTPAASKGRPRRTQRKPLDDVIDSSPISSSSSQDTSPSQTHQADDVLVRSPSASRSLSEDAARPVKRQRVSSSPQPQPNSPTTSDSIADASQQSDQGLPSTLDVSGDGENVNQAGHSTVSENHVPFSEPAYPVQPAPRHPTFREAPRFRATQAAPEAGESHPLPDAFSPQRRGAKYVPGGLAAEVRDWLVQVKGASEYDRPAGTSLQMSVSECVQGSGMHMVRADKASNAMEQDGHVERVILAGDGRISGLAKRHTIHTGATISLYQPMWDVDLGSLGHFAVACDWEVGD